MYEFHYLQFAAPAAWLLCLALLAAAICQAGVIYLGIKIDAAVRTARAEVPDVIESHVAVPQRQLREIWRYGRNIALYVALFALVGWLVGLGEWRYLL